MDPESVTLAMNAALIVAQAAADQLAGAAPTAAHRLWDWLRQSSPACDSPSAKALKRLEAEPTSQTLRDDLAAALDERVRNEEAFGSELQRRVAEACAAGVTVGSITQTVSGNKNVVTGFAQGDITAEFH